MASEDQKQPSLRLGIFVKIRNQASLVAYFSISFALSLVSALRISWSWPDVSLLTNLLFVDDIDAFLTGRFNDIHLMEPISQHAMTGYKWFQVLNAWLFGLDARVEIWCYFVLMFSIAAIVGMRLSSLVASHRLSLYALPIPAVLCSMVGAGSRGMELGTYFGVAVFVALVDAIDSRLSPKHFLIVVAPASAVLIFFFLGGYGTPLFLASLFLFLFKYRYGGFATDQWKKAIYLVSSTLVALAIYFFLFIIFGAGNESDSPSLPSVVREDFLFPFKYIVGGQAASLITNQTLETLEPSASEFITLAIGAGVVALAVISIVRSRRNPSGIPSLGLFLASYGIATALFLLPLRSSDSYQLLNTWYSFHLKISLVGSMMLLISGARNRSGRVGINFELTAITSVLLIVLVLANHRQFERQPLERQYFGSIAEASRIPLLLTEDSSGVTELRLSMPASREAIRVLRKHRLGVFRSASDTEDPLVVPRGDTYSDGWFGPQAIFHVVSDRCKSLFLTLTAAYPIDQNSVRIQRNSQLYGTFDVSSSGREINIPLDAGDDVVELEFSDYRVPQDLGLSADLRRLSALVDYRCG